VSTTISNSQRGKIGDALRSALPFVDACLLLDTGIEDDTIEVAKEICGDKLVVKKIPWTNDFSAARNAALEAATALGASWALTLDTDERISTNGLEVASYLRGLGPEACAVHVRAQGETYAKERLFRLPTTRRWSGETHECFPAAHCPEAPKMRFRELAKTSEETKQKLERDLDILSRAVEKRPSDSRSWYYLGQTYKSLDGRKKDALIAYRKAELTSSWDEETAWSAYLQAQLLFDVGQIDEAIATCARGMAKHAEMPELPWYAGWLSLKKGDHVQAARWARVAQAMNGVKMPVRRRLGFSYPLAMYDGPSSVLVHALKGLGDADGAADAETSRKARMLERIEKITNVKRMRFQIVIGAKDDAFKEIAELLQLSFKTLRYEADISREIRSERGLTPIILAAHLLDCVPDEAILWNFEQVTPEDWAPWKKAGPLLASRPWRRVWEYSRANSLLHHSDPPVLVPLGHHPEMKRFEPMKDPPHELSFVGTPSPRRMEILDELRKRKIKISIAHRFIYGAAKEFVMARSRALLNVHLYETGIFEQPRVAHALNNLLPVLSEVSREKEGNLPEGPDTVVPWRVPCFDYATICDDVEHVLSTPDELRRLSEKSFEAFERCSMPRILERALQETFSKKQP
jgi:tetratricopeptide (TPR) repeat protein